MSTTRRTVIRHEFVELMPRPLEEGVLYVSITHRLALHRCFCGCGFEVATPLAPHEWKLGFDGETVSLSPSVGVWGLECQSHYWVKHDRVVWDKPMSKEKIERLRRREHDEVDRLSPPDADADRVGAQPGRLERFRRWFYRL
jgi:hypothetical protein